LVSVGTGIVRIGVLLWCCPECEIIILVTSRPQGLILVSYNQLLLRIGCKASLCLRGLLIYIMGVSVYPLFSTPS